MAALAHLDDLSSRNQALVNGREIVQAAPSASIEQRLITAFQTAPSSMLQGLLLGDEASELAWIVEQLHRLTEIPYIFVGEMSGEDWDHVQTLELLTPEGRGENIEYDLRETPCANVMGKTACIYPASVTELFPNDELLREMGVESYMGLPLFDPGGRPLGILALLDQKACSDQSMRETLSLMLAFRPRLETLLINRRGRRDILMLSQALEGNGEPLGRLIRSCAHVMNVRCAFVAEFTDETHRRLRTVATAIDGSLHDPVEYEFPSAHLDELEVTGELLIPKDLDQACPQLRTIGSFPAHGSLMLRLDAPDGRAIGLLGLLHDRPLNRHIGEQPVIRAFRQQIQFELYRRRDEAERQATQRRLLELQRAEGLGILAGGIAHDFNNLLVGVLGNAELALADLSTGHDDDIRECLVDIRDAAQAASQLCRQMLAYSGRTTVTPKRFDLTAEIEELARLLSASIPPSVELLVEPSEGSCWINGDLVQIRQVLMNLITNAADAIVDRKDDRPGHITVSLGSPCMHESDGPIAGVTGTLVPGNYVRLSVRDDGCGMDEATLARIFDPFFTTKPHGHGLGLAAMLGVVRAHGGTLTVESTPGVGSCFTVYFPLTDASDEPKVTRPQTLSAARRFCVLVVDDQPRVRKVARRMLERANYEVMTAIDGIDALEIFERERDAIDCVVLDLGMPRLGGIETMQRLRALVPDLPVVLSSGYSKGNALEVVVDDPCCLLVHKPYDVEALTNAVAQLLEHRACGQDNSPSVGES
jgi:two-component system cell cycle sensor histidine kinase/response regulator CckA